MVFAVSAADTIPLDDLRRDHNETPSIVLSAHDIPSLTSCSSGAIIDLRKDAEQEQRADYDGGEHEHIEAGPDVAPDSGRLPLVEDRNRREQDREPGRLPEAEALEEIHNRADSEYQPQHNQKYASQTRYWTMPLLSIFTILLQLARVENTFQIGICIMAKTRDPAMLIPPADIRP